MNFFINKPKELQKDLEKYFKSDIECIHCDSTDMNYYFLYETKRQNPFNIIVCKHTICRKCKRYFKITKENVASIL